MKKVPNRVRTIVSEFVFPTSTRQYADSVNV